MPEDDKDTTTGENSASEALLNEPDKDQATVSEELPLIIPKTKSDSHPPPKYRKTKYIFAAGINGTIHFDSFIGASKSYTNILGGTAGFIRFGLDGGEFMWSIEQQFGGLWGLAIYSGSKDMTRYDAATLAEFGYLTRVSKRWQTLLTIGVGFLYNMHHTGKAAYGDILAVDNNGTSLSVGYKPGFSFIYFFMPFAGIGFELSYLMGVDIGSYAEGEFADREGNRNNPDQMLLEIVQPGISYFMKFQRYRRASAKPAK